MPSSSPPNQLAAVTILSAEFADDTNQSLVIPLEYKYEASPTSAKFLSGDAEFLYQEVKQRGR